MNKTRRRKRARAHRANQIAYLEAWRDEMMAGAVELEPGVFMADMAHVDYPDDPEERDDIPF